MKTRQQWLIDEADSLGLILFQSAEKKFGYRYQEWTLIFPTNLEGGQNYIDFYDLESVEFFLHGFAIAKSLG